MTEDEELELLQLEKEKAFSQQPQEPREFIKQPKTFGERAKEVGIASGIGGAAGIFTPELAMGAGQVMERVPYKPVQMAGRAMQAAVPSLTGAKQRAIGAATGAFSGASGETAGQLAELLGAPEPVAEGARVFGSLAPIEVITRAPKAALGFVGRAMGMPGGITALRSVMDDVGVSNLSGATKDLVLRRINELRASPYTTDAQKKIYDVLSQDVQQMRGAAAQEAQALERSGARVGAEEQQRATRLAQTGGELGEAKETIVRRAKDTLRDVGDPTRELSDIGATLRDRIVSRFDEQSLARDAAYQETKKARDAVVAGKESKGDFLQALPEFKEMVDSLRSKLILGKEASQQATAPVTEQGLLNAYNNIYSAVTGRKVTTKYLDEATGKLKVNTKVYPTSFEALDAVRRKLGDVAFGKEVSGYEGLTQNVAREYYAKLSEIQSKYAGPLQNQLQSEYEVASRLLDKFRTQRGAKATALDRIDPTKFKADTKGLPADFFKSKQSVQDVIALTGDQALVERAAADYVAQSIANMDARAARSWLNSRTNSDWLSSLPGVQRTAQTYVNNLERAEGMATRAAKIGKGKEAQAGMAAKEATRAEELGVKEGGKVLAAAEKEAQTILGSAEPAARVVEIINKGDRTLWDRIAPTIAAAPKGREILAEAVRQSLADRATQGIFGTIRFWESSLKDSLGRTGLMGARELDQISRQLREIQDVAIPEQQKLTLAGRLIKNAIVGYVAPGAYRTVEGVINQRGQIGSVAPNLGAR
jgi:hypothetical protein